VYGAEDAAKAVQELRDLAESAWKRRG
jgi:hypothetical protein